MRTYWHPVCDECILNHNCLFQSNGDVEDCEDIKKWNREDEQSGN